MKLHDRHMCVTDLIRSLTGSSPERLVVVKVYDNEQDQFLDFYVRGICSYRGFYEDLAILYTDNIELGKSAGEFLDLLKSSVGKFMTGYKGGHYRISGNTVVWATASQGEVSDLAVTGAAARKSQHLIMTTSLSDET